MFLTGAGFYFRVFYIVVLMLVGSACAPVMHKPGPDMQEPSLINDAYRTADGVILPVHHWQSDANVRSVIIALHGFNDYGRFFNDAGEFLADQGIVSYAYDQRGFGDSDQPGLWAGVDAYLEDLRGFVQLIHQKHIGLPIYLLGESMGGAVVLAAVNQAEFPPVAGLILSAPAVWGREVMPWYQRWLLAVSARTVPQMHVTGSGLKITPSDNIDMLRALWEDPLVIKKTRIDSVYGLVNLMDAALQASADVAVPVCLLYGERDQIIPTNAVSTMLESIRAPDLVTTALYANGYHMLLRDLEAKTVWTDIANWIFQPDQPLPSGAEDVASARLFGAR
ncbi:MAG: lysophospholipase [Methylococcales bacterium]